MFVQGGAQVNIELRGISGGLAGFSALPFVDIFPPFTCRLISSEHAHQTLAYFFRLFFVLFNQMFSPSVSLLVIQACKKASSLHP